MGANKQINQLNNAGEIQSSDYVALAQSGQSEATKATISDLAAAVGELNSTGTLAELELDTSLGKNLLAQRLTEKGQTCSPSDTLISMADKLQSLSVNDEKTELKFQVYDVTGSYTETNPLSSYKYACRIPGTNKMVAVNSACTLLSIFDSSNNLSLLGSCELNFTNTSPSSSITMFCFSRTGEYFIVRVNAQYIGIHIKADGTPEVYRALSTFSNQYNTPLLLSNDGTKLLVVNTTSTSSTSTNSLSMYNLTSGTTATCTNVSNYYFDIEISSSYTPGPAYNMVSADDQTVYSMHVKWDSVANKYLFYIVKSIIDWTNNSFTYKDSFTTIELNNMAGPNGLEYCPVCYDPQNNMFYCLVGMSSNSANNNTTVTYGPYLTHLFIIKADTATYKELPILRPNYIKENGAVSSFCGDLYVEYYTGYSMIYTSSAIVKYTYNTDSYEFVSKVQYIPDTKLFGKQFYCSFMMRMYGGSNSYYHSNTSGFYRNGNSIGNVSKRSVNSSYTDLNSLSTASSCELFTGTQANTRHFPSPEDKQYTLGTLYSKNGYTKTFFLTGTIISDELLASGALDSETTKVYLEEDTEEETEEVEE